MSCIPIGIPVLEPKPTGSDAAGRPARLAGTVMASAAYPAVAGSIPVPAKLGPYSSGAHVGAVGVSSRSTPVAKPTPAALRPNMSLPPPNPPAPPPPPPLNTPANSSATFRRTRCALSKYRDVISVPRTYVPTKTRRWTSGPNPFARAFATEA